MAAFGVLVTPLGNLLPSLCLGQFLNRDARPYFSLNAITPLPGHTLFGIFHRLKSKFSLSVNKQT